MSATAGSLTYWGRPAWQWETSMTTMDTARRNPEAEDRSQNPQDVVLIVAPSEAAFGREDRKPWYRVSGLSRVPPRILIWESPSGAMTATSKAQAVLGSTEVDPRVWRGIFAVHPTRKILFSQTVEVRTETLRRRSPRAHVDRRTLEREDD